MKFGFVMSVVFLILSSSSHSSETVMECEDEVYKFVSPLFGDAEVFVRIDGDWQLWCPNRDNHKCGQGSTPPCRNIHMRLIGDHSGICKSDMLYNDASGVTTEFKDGKRVLDFKFRSYSETFRVRKDRDAWQKYNTKATCKILSESAVIRLIN